MKYVLKDISAIAHAWANKTQESARNSTNNFYFDGDTIYSYGSHFAIAKHMIGTEGVHGVLFTNRSYSNTTSKHVIVTRQACSHLLKIYCSNPTGTPKENFDQWIRQAEATAAKLTTARKPEMYLSALASIGSEVAFYSHFVGAPVPEVLTAVLSIGSGLKYQEYTAKKEQFEAEAAAKAAADRKKAFTKALNKWVKGQGHRLYGRGDRDYLRISMDGNHVETSQAVDIPIEYAKKLWKRVVDGTLKEGDKVLRDFTVISVDKKSITIGCHTFPVDYLVKFGQKHFA